MFAIWILDFLRLFVYLFMVQIGERDALCMVGHKRLLVDVVGVEKRAEYFLE